MSMSFKVLLLSSVVIALSAPAVAQTATPKVQYLDQGWDDAARQAFYTTGQGSHMMPYAWFKALQRLDKDEPFGADQLERYGYIANERATGGLPIGFVVDNASGDLGMTCAACHTAQLEYQKDGATQVLRIDGAPATANFQLFLADLTDAARATLNDADRFDKFAHAALGQRYSASRARALKSDFKDWVDTFGSFMDKSLPKATPWGPGRLDAFGMIFNRVAGKDLKIADNIKVADAPVSYPFLWNASKQDKTQWNGGVPNGLFLHALGRNTGEVFGVFADFSPRKAGLGLLPLIDYKNNSVNFRNLQALEEKIAALKAPKWPFAIDTTRLAKGEELFKANCAGCHAEKPSDMVPGAWKTPVVDAGTDRRMYDNANRTSDPGPLKDVPVPVIPVVVLENPAKTHDILATTVVGALTDDSVFPLVNPTSAVWIAVQKDLPVLFPSLKDKPLPLLLADPVVLKSLKTQLDAQLTNMFKPPNDKPDAPAAYESRVLHGIWAAPPYLHNGSVPSLFELLLPPDRRSPSFMVGSRKYDIENAGYVTTESPYGEAGKLVVGAGAAPGNSNAGHNYTEKLTDDDRKALLEYLKQL